MNKLLPTTAISPSDQLIDLQLEISQLKAQAIHREQLHKLEIAELNRVHEIAVTDSQLEISGLKSKVQYLEERLHEFETSAVRKANRKKYADQ
jgi:uncharacterized coiled-coil protein SlyX